MQNLATISPTEDTMIRKLVAVADKRLPFNWEECGSVQAEEYFGELMKMKDHSSWGRKLTSLGVPEPISAASTKRQESILILWAAMQIGDDGAFLKVPLV